MDFVISNFRNSVLKCRTRGVSVNVEARSRNASTTKRPQPLLAWRREMGISRGTQISLKSEANRSPFISIQLQPFYYINKKQKGFLGG